MTPFWRKLRGWLRRSQLDTELQEEMQTHLAMKASDSGDPRIARRQFGNTTRLAEDSRAVWGWPSLEAWARDFRYALRGLARRPGFTATVVATLALGIGTSSTIFSLIDTVLVRPLPYPRPERLLTLRELRPGGNLAAVAPVRLEEWQRLNISFEGIAGSYRDTLVDTTGAVPERVSAAYVSPRFFTVMGTPALLGRVLTPEEEATGGPLVVMISERLWRNRFSGDPRVLGRSLVLTGKSHIIVGVMPQEFRYPSPDTEAWIPKQASAALLRVREARFYNSVGRLRPGVTWQQAQADLTAVQRKLGEQYSKSDAGSGAAVEPMKDGLIGKSKPALWMLLGCVSLLLLIACANVACLLLARLNSRTAEIATRCSLGAGRAAIARQLLAEGLTYAILGGLLGTAGTFAGIQYLRKQLPDVPRIVELAPDLRVIAMIVAVSILSALLFSIAPMLRTFRHLTGSLRQTTRSISDSSQRLPRLLVSTQLALATSLLIGAGLLLQSLVRLYDAPLGIRAENILALRVGASFSERAEAVVQRHQRIMERLSTIPDVQMVAMSAGLPGVNPTIPREFAIVGAPTTDGTARFARWRMVTSNYFQALGIPFLEGKSCRMETAQGREFAAVVNRSFADRFFPGRSPVGHTLSGGAVGNSGLEIVGVVTNVREDGHGIEPEPLVYGCGYLRFWPEADVLLKTSNPALMAHTARRELLSLEPSRPLLAARPLPEMLEETLAQTRVRTLLVGLFSLMALVLSAIGLYGLMAYTVSQRTREIGIRMALGAAPSRIVAGLVRSGAMLALAGALGGIAIAATGATMMGTLLYGVKPSEVTAYLLAVGVLMVVALIACLIPGRRAVSIDPLEALREQ